MSLNRQTVEAILEAGRAKAREIGVAVSISVLDRGAHLKAVHRMDSAVLESIETSRHRAASLILGIPLLSTFGEHLGAVGVSGAGTVQDLAIAQAAVAAFHPQWA